MTTFGLIVLYWFTVRRAGLPARLRRGANALLHTAALQVVLGISALLLAVPIVLGVAHQATAMLLLTVTVLTVHSLRHAEI